MSIVEQKPIVVNEPIEVIVHEALVPALIEWLNSRNLVLVKWDDADGHLETYMVVPREV